MSWSPKKCSWNGRHLQPKWQVAYKTHTHTHAKLFVILSSSIMTVFHGNITQPFPVFPTAMSVSGSEWQTLTCLLAFGQETPLLRCSRRSAGKDSHTHTNYNVFTLCCCGWTTAAESEYIDGIGGNRGSNPGPLGVELNIQPRPPSCPCKITPTSTQGSVKGWRRLA